MATFEHAGEPIHVMESCLHSILGEKIDMTVSRVDDGFFFVAKCGAGYAFARTGEEALALAKNLIDRRAFLSTYGSPA